MATKTQTSTNLYDTWINAQKDFVNQWQESSKKWQNTVADNNPIAANRDVFNSWFQKQSELAKEATNVATNVNTTDNPAQIMSNLYKNQLEWITNFNTNNLELSKELLNNNQKVAQDVSENIKKNSGIENNVFENWKNVWTDMFNASAKAFSGNKETNNAYSNLFNTAENYMKAFELWMPIFKAYQNKDINTDWFKNYFSEEKYKQMMDQYFQFLPKNWKETTDQNWKQIIETLKSGNKQGMSTLLENVKTFSQAASTDVAPLFTQIAEFNTKYSEQMQKLSSPFIKMMTPGKEKEQLTATIQVSEDAVNWNIRNTQMQFMMAATAMKSVETFANGLIEKAQKDEPIDSFLNFYTLWLNTNDAQFVELFRSKEYSKVQAEFTSYGLKIKNAINGQIESLMAQTPVVTRTEMDELYETVYNLNKKVKALETELAEAKAAKPTATATKTVASAAPKATATKTTTAKKSSSSTSSK